MGQVWTWITDGIAHLLGGLKTAAFGIVGKVLSTFGLSLVTFEALLPRLKEFVLSLLSGAPQMALEMLAATGIGEGMSMIFSALTVRLAWKVMIVPTTIAQTIQGGGP